MLLELALRNDAGHLMPDVFEHHTNSIDFIIIFKPFNLHESV